MKRIGLILAALLGLAVQAAPASADIVYALNCSVQPCSGAAANNNYGTVTLADAGGGHLTATVQLVAGENFVTAASGYSLVWNSANSSSDTLTVSLQGANASNFAFQPITTNGYFADPFTKQHNCNGANGASCFDYAIAHTGASTTDSKLVFDITKTGGLTLAPFAANGDNFNFFFAALIKKGADTFYVASNKVPEPQTWLTLFAGLLLLPVLLRRRKLIKAV